MLNITNTITIKKVQRSPVKHEVSNYAVNVQNTVRPLGSKVCMLCRADSKDHVHFINQCTVYSDAYKKVEN